MGRLGKPEEVARAIAFLSSPAAAFTTGAQLEISGATSRHICPLACEPLLLSEAVKAHDLGSGFGFGRLLRHHSLIGSGGGGWQRRELLRLRRCVRRALPGTAGCVFLRTRLFRQFLEAQTELYGGVKKTFYRRKGDDQSLRDTPERSSDLKSV